MTAGEQAIQMARREGYEAGFKHGVELGMVPGGATLQAWSRARYPLTVTRPRVYESRDENGVVHRYRVDGEWIEKDIGLGWRRTYTRAADFLAFLTNPTETVTE